MKVGSPKESFDGESRVAMTPASAGGLQKLGHDCLIESGAGAAAGYPDDAYKEAGVEVVASAQALFERADVITKAQPPEQAEIAMLNSNKTLISFFYPAQNEALCLVTIN